MAKKILIAEDDEAILDVVKSILESEGHTVLIPRDEHHLYKIVHEEVPDLILLDIWLQGADGGKIAKNLKAKPATKDIPVILMSANNSTERIAKEAGADGFLLKPFALEELLNIISH